MDAISELQAVKVAVKEIKKDIKAHQKHEKSRIKSLAKDKNSSKNIALMETVKSGDNGVIEKTQK